MLVVEPPWGLLDAPTLLLVPPSPSRAALKLLSLFRRHLYRVGVRTIARPAGAPAPRRIVDEGVVVDGRLRLVGGRRFAAAPPFATAP